MGVSTYFFFPPLLIELYCVVMRALNGSVQNRCRGTPLPGSLVPTYPGKTEAHEST